MVDQFFGLVMMGLGMKTPYYDAKNVLGESDEVQVEASEDKSVEKEASRDALKRKKQELLSDRKENLEEKRKELQDRMKDKRQEFEEELKRKKSQAQERIKAAREEFKEKLEEIRDERKKKIVENMDERLAALNKRRTDAMSAHLTRMGEILGRIIELADKTEKDTSSVDAAVASAQTAIETAQACITAQAGKTYAVTFNSETTLRSDIGGVHQQLVSDLKVCHELVKSARRSVGSALKALAVLRGEKLEPTPTFAPTVTPEPTVVVSPTAEATATPTLSP